MHEQRPEARLEFNDEQGRRIVRLDRDVFTVGRRAGHDLQLNEKEVSRDHAEIGAPDRWDTYRKALEDPQELAKAFEGLGI